MDDPRGISTPRAAVGAVVIRRGRVLLVKRSNAPQKGKWAVPGGSVKLGETLQEAAEREIQEETGLTIKANEPVFTFDLIERDSAGKLLFHYVIIDLLADYVDGEVCPADDVSDAAWFSPEELRSLVISETTRELLKKIGFLDR
jgi:ADP-ribose pyrophosphatase